MLERLKSVFDMCRSAAAWAGPVLMIVLGGVTSVLALAGGSAAALLTGLFCALLGGINLRVSVLQNREKKKRLEARGENREEIQ